MTTPRSPTASSRARWSRARPTRCGTRSPPPTGSARWMMPTELDAREGGAVVFHMGPMTDSRGQVTGFEPRRRVRLRGGLGDARRPARRRRHAARHRVPRRGAVGRHLRRARRHQRVRHGRRLGERVLDEMTIGWAPMLDNLRLYLTHFPGQHGDPDVASGDRVAGGAGRRDRRGPRRRSASTTVGERVDARGIERRRRALDRRALPAPRRAPGRGAALVLRLRVRTTWRGHRRAARRVPLRRRGCRRTSSASSTAWQTWLDGLTVRGRGSTRRPA